METVGARTFGPITVETFGEPLSPEAERTYELLARLYESEGEKEFDPNQPRDERGQWTSEGTGEEYTVGGFAVWQPPVSSRRQVEATIREINKWPKNKDPWVPNTNNERMFGTAAFSVTQQDATGSMGEPAAYLSLDLVRSTERGSNDVIRGMNELTRIADRHQVTIVLDAVSFNINEHFTPSTLSQEKLFKFYEHFGFRKTMPGVSNHMARAPRAPKR